MKELHLSKEELECLTPLEEYAANVISSETEGLHALIDVVYQTVDIRMASGEVRSSINLSAFELEALALRIPAECLRLQSRLNEYSVKGTFRDMKLDAKVTETLAEMAGVKGTAEERKKKAELSVLDERVQNAVNKLIVKGIQSSIERADKVYEGIKKVMDYRSKEGWFDRKGP